MKMFIISLFII